MKRLLLILATAILALTLAGVATAEPITIIRTVTITNVRPHHQRYWWPAMDNCTISAGTYRNGSWHATPYITCAPQRGGWSSTPQQIGNAPGDINPADNVAAAYGPCGYQNALCQGPS